MTCTLHQSSKQCSVKAVADGHRTWLGPTRATCRPVSSAKRSRRNRCIEAGATAVQERVAGLEETFSRPVQVLSRGTSSAQPPVRHTEVEVHLSVRYKCAFGTRLAVIGSQQGWQTSAAVPMTWSSGDVWNVTITLPVGSDIEYKYIVISESGSVIRWQEGGNNRLSLQSPGYLLHVEDTWAQDQRQVHEVGLPAAAAAAAQHTGSSSSRGREPYGSVAGGYRSSSAAGASSSRLQNNIVAGFARPAAVWDAPSAVAPAQQPQQQQQKQKQSGTLGHQRPHKQQQRPALSRSSSAEHLHPLLLQEHQQQLRQQRHETVPSELSIGLDQLLPLLQSELADALDALSSCGAVQDASTSDLIAEGKTVLGALQQQINPSAAAGAASSPAQQAVPNHSSSSSIVKPSSSSSSRRGTRSPGGSPGSSLAAASVDEIAAALLSDDCEEACYCLVDAICSCAGSDGAIEECCEVSKVYERSGDHQITAAEASSSLDLSSVSSSSDQGESAAAAAVGLAAAVSEEAVPAEQLALQSAPAASADLTAAAAEVDAATRAAAFADVQRALDHSAQLLEHLSDPTHPMMLQADREVAVARQHVGNLLPA